MSFGRIVLTRGNRVGYFARNLASLKALFDEEIGDVLARLEEWRDMERYLEVIELMT